MTLDPEFKKQQILVEQTLELIQKVQEHLQELMKFGMCENSRRFFVWIFCWRDGRFCTKCISSFS